MNHDGSGCCKTAGEEPQISKEDPSCGAVDGGLEILGKTPAAAEPGEGALDHPPSRRELEAFDTGWALDDFDRPRAAIGNRALQLRAAIDAIGEDMAQLGKVVAQRAQQGNRTVRILDAGFMHAQGEQEALGIGDDVALASLDAFAGINAARAAAFGGRHTLAVDDAGRGGRPAPQRLPGTRHQTGIDPLPGAVVAPAVEIALHRRAWRKVPWQGAPLTAGPQQIKDGVDNLAQIPLARSPQATRRRQQRRDLRPFPGPGIACIAQLLAPILLASDFGPHVAPPSLSANNTESQLTEITQFISGQALRMRIFLNAINNIPHPEERLRQCRKRVSKDAAHVCSVNTGTTAPVAIAGQASAA